MKKKLQKYLSGSNEGFSLVELIIVIAIMAILIGVVALAVIPYLEKSRESKDLQTISTVANALSSAVADSKATASGTITIGSGTATLSAATANDNDAAKVLAAMVQSMGDKEVKLSSGVGANQDLVCYYDTTNSVVVAYVAQHDATVGGSAVTPYSGGSTVQNCKYNDNAPLMVAS